MKFKKLIIFLLIFSFVDLDAQSDIAIGEWKSYLPYNNGVSVAQSAEKIYFATQWSIMSIDKEDNSRDFLSKVDGLTETGIKTIAFDQENELLVIAYDNSILDIVSKTDVFPVFSIKENDAIQGDVEILDIQISDGFAYIATDFGVLQYDLLAKEFGFTTNAGFQFNTVIQYNNFLVAGTVDGAYYFDLNDNKIPNDFGNWNLIDSVNGLPFIYNALDLAEINNQLVICTSDTIYQTTSDFNFTSVYENDNPDQFLKFVEPIEEGYMVGVYNDVTRSKLVFLNNNHQVLSENDACTDRINNAIQDEKGDIWIGDNFSDFRHLSGGINGNCMRELPDSPRSHTASEVAIKDDVVYVASGGVKDNFTYQTSRDGFYVLEENDWTNVNHSNNNIFQDKNLQNIFTIIPHPTEDKFYAGSYYSGLIEVNLEAESYEIYDKDNTVLQGAEGDIQRTRISGLAFDKDGNLWIANHSALRPLSVLTSEGQWHSFDVGSQISLAQIAVDESNLIWAVVTGVSGGIIVYDHKGTIADPSDDEKRFINTSNSEFSTGQVNSVAVDKDGEVWVGTAEGPVIFECGSSAIQDDCTGSTRKVLQDSIPAILLQTENIRSIEIDGANRKWFGTQRGVFVQSPDGEDQIFHFTEDNSPLFDNTVNDISYNENTGEMFFATNKGLLSYRTGSTGANDFRHADQVYAFPNPVRPDYDGPIAIKGLVRNANVKITNLNGELVFETEALGGQAIWDGRDYNGKKAVSGVYLVFSSSTDNFRGANTHVAKILLVR